MDQQNNNYNVPKLSIVAQFDDLCRQQNSIKSSHAIENDVIGLLKSMEQCRLRWSANENEMERLKSEIKRLEALNKSQETKLTNVRYALTKEIAAREKMQKERDGFYRKLSMVRQLLMEDNPQEQSNNNNYSSARDRVLSCLNFAQLEAVQEVESSDSSDIDLDYDKTEDDFLEFDTRRSQGKRKSSDAHRKSAGRPSDKHERSKRSRPEETDIEMGIDPIDNGDDNANENCFTKSPKRAERPVNSTPSKKQTTLFRSETAYSPAPRVYGKQFTSSTPQLPKGLTLPKNLTPKDLARAYSNQRLENRMHSFVTKKVFRPGEKCGPCGGSIGFMASCFRCRDCRATCHPDCKDKVALPCVPYVNRNDGMRGRHTLISDFAPTTRPQVPAIIVHCVQEIERKGLEEAGLYRIPGSDREVKELKERIIKSKNGIPSLVEVEVHVLCGVIKEFLRSLDEPLVTRVLWRDFVRASEYSQAEERINNVWHAVNELPTANKDTLAYLMKHLQRVAQSPQCKMPKMNLARVFGPTIIGHSMPDVPTVEMLAENKKQIAVMETLLDVSEEWWSSVYGDNDEFVDATESVVENPRRSSLTGASRPLGGTLQINGTMTPRVAKPSIYGSSANMQKRRYLKPLF